MYWYILCVVIVSGAVVAYLQSLGSLALVDLSDCCCFRYLPRLGELVDQILFERQLAQPPPHCRLSHLRDHSFLNRRNAALILTMETGICVGSAMDIPGDPQHNVILFIQNR